MKSSFFKVILVVGILGSNAETSSAENAEGYSVRPNILDVTPRPHFPSDSKHLWPKYKMAQLESVAMLLEMYPDHDLYFLARDGEYLYDLAKVTTRDEPSVAKRIHLLNVSRRNVGDPNLVSYLSQEGITNESLKAGKKILFVDSGFSGSISAGIQSHFEEQLRSQIKTHLLASSNSQHPSTWIFHAVMDPQDIYYANIASNTIEQLEALPHFTNSAYSFHKRVSAIRKVR